MSIVKEKGLEGKAKQAKLMYSVCERFYVDKIPAVKIAEEIGVNRGTVYRYLLNFEAENPQIVEAMKKNGKEITPQDYDTLRREVASLKKKLATEKLRADFYQETVAYAKEVMGIDLLKKAGAK